MLLFACSKKLSTLDLHTVHHGSSSLREAQFENQIAKIRDMLYIEGIAGLVILKVLYLCKPEEPFYALSALVLGWKMLSSTYIQNEIEFENVSHVCLVFSADKALVNYQTFCS